MGTIGYLCGAALALLAFAVLRSERNSLRQQQGDAQWVASGEQMAIIQNFCHKVGLAEPYKDVWKHELPGGKLVRRISAGRGFVEFAYSPKDRKKQFSTVMKYDRDLKDYYRTSYSAELTNFQAQTILEMIAQAKSELQL